MRIRLPVDRGQAGELARHLGDTVAMDLGGIRLHWWKVVQVFMGHDNEHYTILEKADDPDV